MSLLKDIVGEHPSHMDLIYLLHPRDFLPGDERMHPKTTLTVAEDPKGTRAQSFRIHVVTPLDQGFIQRASYGVDCHIRQYFVLNTSELYSLECYKDVLLADALRAANDIIDDQLAFRFFATISSQANDPFNLSFFPKLAGEARLALTLDQGNFKTFSENIGFVGTIIKQQAERACHFEKNPDSTENPDYIGSSFLSRFMLRSSTLQCRHEDSLALSNTGAVVLDPNPPGYEVVSERDG